MEELYKKLNVTEHCIDSLYDKLNIDEKKLPRDLFMEGLLVEYEHGFQNAQEISKGRDAEDVDSHTNITSLDRNNPTPEAMFMTAKIVLAHFVEGKNYYKYLKEVEEKLDKEREDFFNPFRSHSHIENIVLSLR